MQLRDSGRRVARTAALASVFGGLGVLGIGFVVASGIALAQLLDGTYAITAPLAQTKTVGAAATHTEVLEDSAFVRDLQSGRFFKRQRERRRQYKIVNNDSISKLGAADPGLAPYMRALGLGGSGTYRTVCVRLCDGFYFPISASTTRDRFGLDDRACRSKCGSEARLFVYSAAGGSPDTMVDMRGRAYAKLKTAFLYRDKYDASCKCRAHPWEPDSIKAHKAYASKNWKKKARRLAKVEARRVRKARRVARWRARELAKLQRELLDADDEDDKRDVIERWRSRLPGSVITGRTLRRVQPRIIDRQRIANVPARDRVMRLGVRQRPKQRPRVRKRRNTRWKAKVFNASDN